MSDRDAEKRREERQREVAASRREFLKGVLKTGSYAAPAVVCMSMRNLAYAQATWPHHHHHWHDDDPIPIDPPWPPWPPW